MRFHKISTPGNFGILRSVRNGFVIEIIYPLHCMKSVRILSFSGPHFPAFALNADQKNSEYGHYLGSAIFRLALKTELQTSKLEKYKISLKQKVQT